MTEVNVIDAVMGSGKTSAMINYINKSDSDIRFLYITPYLDEVKRIVEMCKEKKFVQPEEIINKKKVIVRSKGKHIKELLRSGKNIVSTHSMFHHFDEETIEIAHSNNYVLIMDEVADVISKLDISDHDLETILEKYTEVVDGHLLKWTERSYKGDFKRYMNLCDLECIGIYGDMALLWLFPVSTFKAFNKIYLLTYLFDAQVQKYYFDYYNVNYKQMYVKGDNINNYEITYDYVEYPKLNLVDLVNICDSEKLNRIGEFENSLSKTWYLRNKGKDLMQVLKNNTYNYFKNYTKTPSQMNLWTTFKDHEQEVSGKGYARGFISSNLRATNKYKDRNSIAYLINKFFNPLIKNFFIINNIDVNEDKFALSEMIQFIWRSAIRDGKEINIYIPSKRMRELLINWLKDE